LLLWLLYALREIFVPLLIALILAHVFNPVVTYTEEKWRWPRPVTAALLLAIFVLGMAAFLSWLGPLLFAQVSDLLTRLPGYLRTLAANYSVDPGNIVDQLESSLRKLQVDFQALFSRLYQTAGQALGLVTSVFSVAGYVIFSAALVLIYFFVFSWRFNSALQASTNYLPHARQALGGRALKRITHKIPAFER
jgi:predicted PurR-regulated permease PerM